MIDRQLFDRAYDIVYISDRSGWSRAFVFPFLIWTSIPHSTHQEALFTRVLVSDILIERPKEDPSILSSITETALHRPNIAIIILPRPRPDRKNKRLTKKGEIIKRYIQKSEDHNEVQEYHCKCALDAVKICWKYMYYSVQSWSRFINMANPFVLFYYVQ